MKELLFQPIQEIAPLIKKHSVSPVELTRTVLEQIQGLEPRLNAFITVRADEALAAARKAEAEILAGEYRSPLHGIPPPDSGA